MRVFGAGGVRLWNLSREAKIVFTAYVAFSLLGLSSAVLYSYELTGGRVLAGTREYYAAAEAGTGGGPDIELAPDDARPLVVGVSYRKLLEASHFHLFTVPVLLLIVSHLFMLAGLRPGTTAAWLLLSWGLSLLHLAAPWVIHYGSARLAALMPLSGAAMLLAITFLCLVTAVRMWRPPAMVE